MSRASRWCLGLLLWAAPALAQEPSAGRSVEEVWDAAYLDGYKSGFFHTRVDEVSVGGRKLLRTTLDQHLSLKRFNETITLRMESGTDETPDGKVTAVFMRQFLGKEQQMVLTGTVEGDQLHVKVTGMYQMDKKIPWNDQVLGLYRQHRILKDRAVKPGDTFKYLSFEPVINTVIGVTITARDRDEVEVFGVKRSLLRVEAVPDKIQVGGSGVQLPAMTLWLDDHRDTVRGQTAMPGLGAVVLYRTTKNLATLPGKLPEKGAPDVANQSILLNRRIPRGVEADAVVYRFSLPNDDEPATAVVSDARQQVKNVQGKSFELHVQAVRGPRDNAGPAAKAGDEFLQSNYFINSADAKVQELARQAVGTETDPWKKAQRIESWVHRNMRVLNFTEAMATADHVARTLEGDCSEFAMLTAAMCRAAGVPSRTAIGLVYVELPGKGPSLAYHMWTEVNVQGQWVPLDATLGRGSIGAGHIKVTDHSWHDTQSLVPILPVVRLLLGKPAVEVLRVDGGP